MRIRGCEGTLSLAEIQTLIRFEEAGALELVDCIVSTDKNNQPINTFKFNELLSGTIPADIFLVKANDPKPAGANKSMFTDTLVVGSQFTAVDFYR